MASGSDILASDFVTLQDKVASLLGTSSGTRGYGQPIQSSDVFIGNQITKAQWDLLRYDITSVRYHQDGVLPNILTVNVGDPISGSGSGASTNYNTLIETATTNRFNLADNQSITSTISSATYSSSWSTSASCTLTVTFSTAVEARHFFNSGGKIRISPSLTGGAATSQVNAWKGFLSSVGTRSFGANTDPLINYYTLTNSYQTYYQGSLSTPYSANSYKLEASTNVANNSTGTATILYLKVTLSDAYVDPDADLPNDVVNGTLTIAASELKASGSLFPSGTFTITSPSYSLSSITAS